MISQPFWPAYLTAERIARAPKLKLAITAGIGSDHVDLEAAIERGITVAEVTYSQQHQRLRARRDDDPRRSCATTSRPTSGSCNGGWNIADCVSRSYDLEGMQVGTVAAGRIGSAVLRRLKPFEVGLHYTDRHRLPDERRGGARGHLPPDRRVAGRASATWSRSTPAASGDRAPLRRRADRADEARRLSRSTRPAARSATATPSSRALESGQLAGYAGDVWFPQPAPNDHPWRTMPHHGMTPHTSGHEPLGPGPLRRRYARDPRVLVRRSGRSARST